jgi:hypothetical protein
MPKDTPRGEEQRTMLSFTEAAKRLVTDGIAPSMTAEGLRRLARDPKSGWPIAEGDYRVVGKVRLLPYEVLVPYMRERLEKRRGRGPDKGRRKRPAKQEVVMSSDARAILTIVWKWIADANDGYDSDVGDLMHELESAGYGPPGEE